MKTKRINLDRLTPLLGITLVALVVVAGATYLNLEQKIHSAEAFAVTIDHLHQNQALGAVLKTMHDGNAGTAAQQLDILLCDNILRINAELASADDRKAAYVKDCFMALARVRPKNPPSAGGASQELSADQVEAEKILLRACAGVTRATEDAQAKR